MGSSIRNTGLIQRFFCVAVVSLLLLTGCGDEDPIVEATGEVPTIENFGVAYLKRRADALNINANQATNFPPAFDDPANPTVGVTPGDVFYIDTSTGEPVEKNITSGITAPIIGVKSAGDVSDLEVSYDGNLLIFAMHEGMYEGRMDDEQPTWNIWIYDVANEILRQAIPVDVVGTAEFGNDIDPHFLPDGRIVFSSDRRDGDASINLVLYGLGPEDVTVNERNGINSGRFAFALHVMNVDGTGIKQITFNPSNDLNPTVLKSGKILFSRWDGIGPRDQLDLYTVNPDGTEMDIYYGAHSHNVDGDNNTPTEHYVDFKQMPDGTLIGMFSRLANTRGRTQIISIDHENFVEFNQKRFTSPTMSTQGQTSAIATPFLANAIVSRFGSYTTPFPIYESGQTNRVLVSWDGCRVMVIGSGIPEPCSDNNILDTSGYELAEPLFSMWIYDLDRESRGSIGSAEPGFAIVNPVARINRPIAQRPAILVDKTSPLDLDPDMELRRVGAISIKSVYDTVGSVTMVDDPLEPRGANNLLTAEEALIPTTTIEMDAVTGAVVTDRTDPAVVPVARTVADIPAIRLSTVTNTADQRVARFVRISKAVPKVDLAGDPLTGDDFGRTGGYGMQEILGYSVVEPDGSVFVEVPADVPFTVSILDAKGRSFMSHTNWMQVRAGETKVCGGCHNPGDGQAPMNIGAATVGPFPNTVSTMIANVGETMAETRARLDCLGPCNYPKLKRDPVYDDPWTDQVLAGRLPDASFSISYTGLVSSPVNNEASCNDLAWDWGVYACRIAINFPTHIQPILDARCVSCHNDNDPNAVPPGNLVLESGGIADPIDNPLLQALRDARTDTDRSASYEFLFVARPRMETAVGGGLRFIVERDPVTDEPIDANGIPIGETDIGNLQFIDQRPGLVSAGVARARHSHLTEILTGDILFPAVGDPTINLVDNPIIATPTVNHTTILTPAELRLLLEWMDNGTQNYNGLNAALAN